MPPVETLDPALILDEWINRTQNLPEELRFMQDEIADKDRQYDKLIREIEDRDMRIQKWIKAHGSHHPNPKEEEYRATIRKNFAQAEQLSSEKLALTQKLQQIVDKHIRQLDLQLKMLYDRAEPGFTDPDELPSLLRPSPANAATNGILRNGASPAPGASAAPAALNTVPARVANAQVRGAHAQQQQQQQQQHASASAPASPAASMIMSRQARESSAGPVGKRLPRSNSGLGNLPATSSGLARHASLGPGTPKGSQTAAGLQRAGSAGPRVTSKGSLADRVRKGTPSGAAGRKKGTPAAGATPPEAAPASRACPASSAPRPRTRPPPPPTASSRTRRRSATRAATRWARAPAAVARRPTRAPAPTSPARAAPGRSTTARPRAAALSPTVAAPAAARTARVRRPREAGPKEGSAGTTSAAARPEAAAVAAATRWRSTRTRRPGTTASTARAATSAGATWWRATTTGVRTNGSTGAASGSRASPTGRGTAPIVAKS
ncbi:hypothetical protein VTJ83DRAFT_569 [Remersonia thermophila]|uniref:Inhibitor of growth protein N-terminal histone-binding domain-containing protein n=1 Tax=Remersonia thermophila TaxID=72144 RepID=A0ABR4DLB2_9PEZI